MPLKMLKKSLMEKKTKKLLPHQELSTILSLRIAEKSYSHD
jgi:hypothetical protein